MTGLSNDMFEPLADDELRVSECASPADKSEDPKPIIPAPVDAPEVDWSRLRPKDATEDPIKVWLYHAADGEFVFYVVRWTPRNPCERKIVRPATWCRFPDGREEWALKAMPSPRPLHNLPAIVRSPDKSVVVTEGETCADAATGAFLDHAVTTWAGGSRAWQETDWTPLIGRQVLLLADADDRGREAMRGIAAHLLSMGCTIRVHLPAGDDGRDIVDWLDEDGVCCFARYLTTDFSDCFTRSLPGFPRLFGLFRSAAPVLAVSEVGAGALSD